MCAVEGGARLADCAAEELPEHVREHGGGLFFTLESLRIADAGFECDEASKRIWDGLLEGSSYALKAETRTHPPRLWSCSERP